MSEYLSRNEFGPVLVTIDSIRPGHASIRFESAQPVMDAQENDGTTAVTFDGISLMALGDMFLWLRDNMMRLLYIRGAVVVCESRIREGIDTALDKAFSGPYSLNDLDYMSHQVGLKERGLADPEESKPAGNA